MVLGGIFASLRFADAHGFGQVLERTAGEYTVQFEYEALELQADESVRLDFAITKKDPSESVEFTDIWVRIAQGNETVFTGSILNPEFGRAGMIFTFPENGEYELSVRFQNKDKTLAEASFPLSVVPSMGNERKSGGGLASSAGWLLGGLIGLGVGFLLSFLAKKRS